MSRSHISLESLARITALDYKIAPKTYELRDDLCGIHGDPDDASSLDVHFYPHTIEDSAVDVMVREGLEIEDLKLQKSMARTAIKYIGGYEEIKQDRELEADRLNNPVH